MLAALAIWKFGPTPTGLAACLLLWALLALTFIDFDTQLLPDDITLPLLWGGLLVQLVVPLFGRTTPTFVCVVSGPPPVMARAGAVATTPAARATTTSPLSVRFRVRAILHSQFD